MTAELHDLAAAYALDALDADERAAFEAHYPQCDRCSVDVVGFRDVSARLSTDDAHPPTDLRASVLAAIAETPQLSAPARPTRDDATITQLAAHRRRPPTAVLSALAVAAALLVAVVGFQVGRSTGVADDQLAELLATPDVVVNTLSSELPGTISVAWSRSAGELAVVTADLGDPGAGFVYELWLLDDTGAVASVLFRPEGRTGTVLGDLPGEPSGWGVTVEPEGGSLTPTSDVIFIAVL